MIRSMLDTVCKMLVQICMVYFTFTLTVAAFVAFL